MPESSATRAIRVYVNAKAVDVPPGSTALTAVRASSPPLADAVVAGEQAIADSRGLAVASDTPVHGGAIFRLIRARPAGEPAMGEE
jgi:hypothetical protein